MEMKSHMPPLMKFSELESSVKIHELVSLFLRIPEEVYAPGAVLTFCFTSGAPGVSAASHRWPSSLRFVPPDTVTPSPLLCCTRQNVRQDGLLILSPSPECPSPHPALAVGRGSLSPQGLPSCRMKASSLVGESPRT